MTPLLNLFERGMLRLNETYPRMLNWALQHRPVTLGVPLVFFRPLHVAHDPP